LFYLWLGSQETLRQVQTIREHQLLDWTKGHSEECAQLDQAATEPLEKITYPDQPPRAATQRRTQNPLPPRKRRFVNDAIFPEFEIVTEQEEEEVSAKAEKLQFKLDIQSGRLLASQEGEGVGADDEDEGADEDTIRQRTETQMQILEGYRKHLRSIHGEGFDEEQFEEDNQIDGHFVVFQEIVEHSPDQVLRYSFANQPLWVHSKGRPTHIPLCSSCGAPRVYEFQVSITYYHGDNEGYNY